jgi:hypothetical protein
VESRVGVECGEGGVGRVGDGGCVMVSFFFLWFWLALFVSVLYRSLDLIEKRWRMDHE